MISRPSRSENATPSMTARVRCAAAVAHGQADEAAARLRVQVRRALAGQVRQEDEALAPGSTASASATSVSKSAAGLVAPPAQRAARRQRDRHQVLGARHARGRTRGRGPTGRARRRRGGRRSRRSCRSTSTARPRARRRRRPPRRRCRRRPRPPAARPGSPSSAASVGAQRAGHLRSLVHRRHPLARDLQRVEDLGRPVARADVEQQRPRRVRRVGRALAGEHQPHVVLRQQHARHARVGVGLVVRAATGSSGPGSRSAPGCPPARAAARRRRAR